MKHQTSLIRLGKDETNETAETQNAALNIAHCPKRQNAYVSPKVGVA